MANLYERLFNSEGTAQIPVHIFEAALVEYMAGTITRPQMVAFWGLDASAESDLNVLLNTLDPLNLANKLRFTRELNAVNILTEAGLLYQTRASYAARLGLTP